MILILMTGAVVCLALSGLAWPGLALPCLALSCLTSLSSLTPCATAAGTADAKARGDAFASSGLVIMMHGSVVEVFA